MGREGLRRTLAALTALAALPIAAGCHDGGGSGADTRHRTGSGATATDQPLVLRLVTPFSADELEPFTKAVETLSAGKLQVSVTPTFESQQVTAGDDAMEATKAGTYDLAAVGVRILDAVGLHSADALIAPLVVDNMAVQERVLASDLSDQMVAGLQGRGFTGVAILAGPMRKPAGIGRPLLGAADYRGASIAIGPGAVAERTIRALGATPIPVAFGGAPLGGATVRPDADHAHAPGSGRAAVDGLEQQVSSIAGNQYDSVGYITRNVDLWPRPVAVLGSADRLSRLTPTQRSWLRQAASLSLDTTIRQQISNDTAATVQLCRRGTVQFVDASPAQRASLRRAVAPVIHQLRQDPETSSDLDRIGLIASGTAPLPGENLSCLGEGTSFPAERRATPLDGTWRMVSTEQEAAGSHGTTPENWGTWTVIFWRGHFAYTQESPHACTWGYGRFEVTDDHFEWLFTDGGGIAPTGANDKPGGDEDFRWSRHGRTMTWGPYAGPEGVASPDNWYVQPWHQLDAAPDVHRFTSRCLPPRSALRVL